MINNKTMITYESRITRHTPSFTTHKIIIPNCVASYLRVQKKLLSGSLILGNSLRREMHARRVPAPVDLADGSGPGCFCAGLICLLLFYTPAMFRSISYYFPMKNTHELGNPNVDMRNEGKKTYGCRSTA